MATEMPQSVFPNSARGWYLLVLLVCLTRCSRVPSLAETMVYIGNLTYVDDFASGHNFEVDKTNPCVIVYTDFSQFGEKHAAIDFSTINPDLIDRRDPDHPLDESVIEVRTTNGRPLILTSEWSRVSDRDPEGRANLILRLKDKRDKVAVVKALRFAASGCGGRGDSF